MKQAITETSFDTGALLTAHCRKYNIIPSSLAKKMGLAPQAVVRRFYSKSLDVNTMAAFSYALGHNFLQDMASQMRPDLKSNTSADADKDAQIEALTAKVLRLEAQLEVLERVAGAK